VFNPNRYKQIPSPDRSPDQNQNQNRNMDPNINPAFGPFDNLSCISFSQVNVVNEMRYLWLQMVIWSRAYITNSVARQEAVPVFYERLYSIPQGFYNYMNTFFGQAIAEQLINLLSQHIIIFTDLINALYVGNQQAANTSQSAWYGNSNSLATFLVQINDTWNYNQWLDLLNRYLEMFLDEAIAVMSSDHRSEIAIYDRLQYQSLLIADYLSRGIIYDLAGNSGNRSGVRRKGFC